MDAAHHLVLLAGALGLLSIVAGLSRLALARRCCSCFWRSDMFGKDGPVGLVFNDFQTAYLIGSVALAVILFEGGLKTKPSMLKIALGPALALATLESRSRLALSAPCSPCFPLRLRPTRLGSSLSYRGHPRADDAAAVAVLLRHAAAKRWAEAPFWASAAATFCGSLYGGWRSRPRSTPCWRLWVHCCCLGLRRVLERAGSSPSIWQASRSAPASTDRIRA